MLKVTAIVCVLMACVPTTAFGQASPGRSPDAVPGPPYRPLPFEEDWCTELAKENRQADEYDSLKCRPLTDDGFVRGTFGAEFRGSYDSYRNLNFGATVSGDDDVFLGRVLLHGELLFGDRARVFGTFQFAEEAGLDGPSRTINVDRGDVQNLFLDTFFDIGNTDLTLRLGRQELSFGAARMVGTRDGPGVRQAFDGGMLKLDDNAGRRLDAFFVVPTEDNIGSFDDGFGDDREFFGLYYTDRNIVPHSSLEAYYFGYFQDSVAFDSDTARSERHTIGARLAGAHANWDWDWEAAYQFGSFGPADISAWTLAAETGYTFDDASWGPRIGLGASVISGDKNRGDGRQGTFEAPFPRGSYFDPAGLVGPRNLLHLQPQISFQPLPKVTTTLYSNHYWRFSDDDGLYNSGGRLVRSGAGSNAREIGHSLALALDWRPTPHWLVEVEFIHFITGDFIEETGPASDTNYFEFEVTYRF